MKQIIFSLSFIILSLYGISEAKAQTSFAQLSGQSAPAKLDWRNPSLAFEFHLPPAPGVASLTIFAKPLAISPVGGSYFLLSVNQHPAVPFSPVARGFSARFDIPKGQLQAGINQVELIFVSGKEQQCLMQPDGGWAINMQKSRFDLALNRPQPKLSQIEDWLSADMGAPRMIVIEQGALSTSAYQEFGALITQALALRMKQVPQITNNIEHADLVIRAQNNGPASPPLTVQTISQIPHLIFNASNDDLNLLAAKWFAQNRLDNPLSSGRVHEWPSNKLSVEQPLETLLKKAPGAAWRTVSRPVELRLPTSASARLQMHVQRPKAAGSASSLHLQVDNKQITAPVLWSGENSLLLYLPASKSAARTISLVSDMIPAKSIDDYCPPIHTGTKTVTSQITLQLAGMDALSELDHIAWNGGTFARENGKNVQIILSEQKDDALFQSWRVIARLAKLGNGALTYAKFGGEPDSAKNLLYIGNVKTLPTELQEKLPKSFAIGGGRAPADPIKKYHSPLVQSALAAPPNTPAIGVAGTAHLSNGNVWMAIGATTEQNQVEALKYLVDGQAIDHFSGNVVRWQGSLVAVNSTDTNLPLPFIQLELSIWNVLILLLFPTGLWSVVYIIKSRREREHKFIRF